MPSQIELNSPRVSKLNICKSCNESVDALINVKCDECKNSFHELCINFEGDTSNPDLIQLCASCSNNGQIYTPGSKSENKVPAKSAIPALGGNVITKSLRSKAISIDVAAFKLNSAKRKPINDSKPLKSFNNNKLDEKIKILETRLSSLENAPRKCNGVLNSKIAELEHTIKGNHEFILNHFNISSQYHVTNLENNNSTKASYDENPLQFHFSLEDKIADIERTIKEDRLMVEQLFINQLDVIERRLVTQEETIKSCEALMELEATNDTLVQNQFEELKGKIKKIEKSVKIQNSILHQLECVIKQHNNTIVTHFELNKAYCADLISKLETHTTELSEFARQRSNDKRVEFFEFNGAKHGQTHTLTKHSNETRTNNAQPLPAVMNDVTKCKIRTQPLRVKGRNDYQRIRIHVNNNGQFKNEKEICDSIVRAFTEFSNEFNAHKYIVTKLKYEPNTNELNQCSLIMVLPTPINLLHLNRFLSQRGFQVFRK